jgi:Fe-S-cluster containining protein
MVNNLQNEIIKTEKIYRELFTRAKESIDRQLDSLKRASLCNKCKEGCDIDFNKIVLLQKFPDGCRYKFWQEAALDALENRISKDIFEKIQVINKRKDDFGCGRCASCCKLASSEYSFEELKERAKNGDIFSAQFVSIFTPYESKEEPRKIYPDYIDLLEKKFPDNMPIYFYYCPKLGADGLCTDYENRPDICRDFPTSPLVAFPVKCSFNKWKEEVEITSLTLHALVDIVGFYKEKLKELI